MGLKGMRIEFNKEDKSFSAKMNTPKYIICDCAKQDWGKTETLLIVNNWLKNCYKIIDGPKIIKAKEDYKKDDCYCVYETPSEVKIAILTYGDRKDDKETKKEYLGYVKNHKPDIFVCASSWVTGNEFDDIEEFATENECKLVVFSNAHAVDDKFSSLNRELYKMSAEQIEDLLERFIKRIERIQALAQQRIHKIVAETVAEHLKALK